MTLYQIVKSIQQAQGSKAKQALLDQHKDNELFKNFMKAVYDPAINYYASKLPKGVAPGNMATLDQEYLDWLAKSVNERAFSGNKGKSLLKVTLATFDTEGCELFGYIIDRSIGANVGDTMVLKTWPDLYFIPPYMRCSLMDDKIKAKFEEDEWFYVQTKMDGAFAYSVPSYDDVGMRTDYELITRQGGKYPTWIANIIGKGNSSVIVGELLVYDQDGKLLDRKTGNGILNSILQGAEQSEFSQYTFRHIAWDELTVQEFKTGKSELSYETRFEALKMARDPALVVNSVRCYSMAEAYQVYSQCVARGEEGVILKRRTGKWKDGTSKDDIKLKIKFEAEFRCTGMYEGTGKAKGMMGGANYTTEDGLMEFNCGTGFSDAQRKHFWQHPEEFVDKVHTLSANDIIQSRDVRKKPALSLPAFEEVRLDKTVANTFAEVIAALEAAKK